MIQLNLIKVFIILSLFQCSKKEIEKDYNTAFKPNLLIIQTDEHNFRTLGCYRDQLSHDQAFVWGDGINVETPNIDFLAKNGVLFTKFYAATPVCSPSRGSLVSGMYPQHTGVPKNDLPMNGDIVTFAEVLSNNGYKTGFIGKWHLDGTGKPQWEPERKFGFADNRFMYNRGHWKKMEDTNEGPAITATNEKGVPTYKLDGADENSFTTDFLTSKTIDFFEQNKENPFGLYLSFPDPHGPDLVRPPYDGMYTGMDFKAPANYNVADADAPAWAKPAKKASINQSQYFGMIKCIDDNIGKIINALREKQLLGKTVIIFTSDHGDLRAEHHRHNKGNPFEASGKVPFIVYYPTKIPAGSAITKAFNTVDFAPTILNFLGQKAPAQMEGRDFSGLLTNPASQESWEDITFMRSTGLPGEGNWVAAVTSRYKLVLAKNDVTWLFDLQEDPNEVINFINNPDKSGVVKELAKKLNEYAKDHSDPFLQGTKMADDLKALL